MLKSEEYCVRQKYRISQQMQYVAHVCLQTVGQQGDRVAWTTVVAIGHTQLNPEV